MVVLPESVTIAAEKPTPSKIGAPAGNSNRVVHRGRAAVQFGDAPAGYTHQYKQGRKAYRAHRAELKAKGVVIGRSIREALIGALKWYIRALCWHKYARRSDLSETERNNALTGEVECHDRYVHRLRLLGLAKPDGSADGSDLPPLPQTLLDELEAAEDQNGATK